jgi:hypothetical protein
MVESKDLLTSTNGEVEKEALVRHDDSVARTPVWAMVTVIVLAVISYVTLPVPLQPVGEPTLQHVWYYGWITALSTGLGVLPLVFIPDFDKYWVGISNGELSARLAYSSSL